MRCEYNIRETAKTEAQNHIRAIKRISAKHRFIGSTWELPGYWRKCGVQKSSNIPWPKEKEMPEHDRWCAGTEIHVNLTAHPARRMKCLAWPMIQLVYCCIGMIRGEIQTLRAGHPKSWQVPEGTWVISFHLRLRVLGVSVASRNCFDSMSFQGVGSDPWIASLNQQKGEAANRNTCPTAGIAWVESS